MDRGYVKVWRKLEDSAFYKNSEAVHVFFHLLFKASRLERKIMVGHQAVELKPGQLVTGRKSISEATGINESKVYRVLELLKSEQVIEQQTNSKFSIISIVNWPLYQEGEQQSEQQVNSKRTASEHKQECKKVKKEPKSIYGEFANVLLTDEELEKLRQRFNGEHAVKIERLSSYLAQYPRKRYDSHYATIINWHNREEANKPKPVDGSLKGTRYDFSV